MFKVHQAQTGQFSWVHDAAELWISVSESCLTHRKGVLQKAIKTKLEPAKILVLQGVYYIYIWIRQLLAGSPQQR